MGCIRVELEGEKRGGLVNINIYTRNIYVYVCVRARVCVYVCVCVCTCMCVCACVGIVCIAFTPALSAFFFGMLY